MKNVSVIKLTTLYRNQLRLVLKEVDWWSELYWQKKKILENSLDSKMEKD